ncbi:MAG: sugar porter family MFS transporter [Thermoleophilia bacterium]
MKSQDPPDAATRAAPPGRRRMPVWLFAVGVVTFIAGLLFGYDQGVISGALPLVKEDLGLGTFAAEIITSWVTLGALIGALIAGTLADRIGRRHTSILAGVLFAGGAVLEAVAPGAGLLTLGRVITGVAVGFASTVAPLYAAEMAPARLRGRFVSSYQLAVTVGIFLAYLADDALTGGDHWRTMFALAIIPGVLLIIGFLVVPESARWLLHRGRREEARASLRKIAGDDAEGDAALAAMEEDLAEEDAEGQASWGEVFAAGMRRPLMIGIGLSVIQQVTGINAVIYYANDIFADAGFATAEDQAEATLYAIGLVNVLATFIAIAYVDRFGRRPLLLAGLVGMTASLAAVGVSFAAFDTTAGADTHVTAAGIFTLVALVVFIASFAFSLGPVVWTMISEIYPNRVRGRAVSIATAANWLAAFLVTQFFLTIVDAIGSSATFFVLAGVCVLSYLWIMRNVPETRGKSLEEIEEYWTGPEPPPLEPPGTQPA